MSQVHHPSIPAHFVFVRPGENRMFPISKVPGWLIAWIWRPCCHPLSLLYLLSIPLGTLQCFLLALMCLCVFRVTGSITFDLRRDVLSPKSLVQSTSHCTKVNQPFTREKSIELCMGYWGPVVKRWRWRIHDFTERSFQRRKLKPTRGWEETERVRINITARADQTSWSDYFFHRTMRGYK